MLELDTIFGFVSEIRETRKREEAPHAETSHTGPCKRIVGEAELSSDLHGEGDCWPNRKMFRSRASFAD